MKGCFIFFSFTFWILQNLAKCIGGWSPLKQHHKIGKKYGVWPMVILGNFLPTHNFKNKWQKKEVFKFSRYQISEMEKKNYEILSKPMY